MSDPVAISNEVNIGCTSSSSSCLQRFLPANSSSRPNLPIVCALPNLHQCFASLCVPSNSHEQRLNTTIGAPSKHKTGQEPRQMALYVAYSRRPTWSYGDTKITADVKPMLLSAQCNMDTSRKPESQLHCIMLCSSSDIDRTCLFWRSRITT